MPVLDRGLPTGIAMWAGAWVTSILRMTDTQSLAEVRARFSEYVERVETEHERVVVTKNGRPAAVLVSTEDLAAMEDSLELLSDPEARAQIEQARTEVRAGQVWSAVKLRQRYSA